MNSKVLAAFYEIITPNKREMFDRIAAERTKHLTVVMENIYQEHNASAVLRSCDCFGIQELHVIEKDNTYKIQRDIALGAGRWVDMSTYDSGENVTKECLTSLKEKGYKIVATTPHTDAHTINDLDLSQPIALVFGTERRGISDEVKELADAFVKIPMYGFTESFNISVSVAITLNTLRQRLEETDLQWKLSSEEQIALKINWCAKILNGGELLAKKFRAEYPTITD
jgi:tRNA (guanosine-2'-O-)-methyltransferase